MSLGVRDITKASDILGDWIESEGVFEGGYGVWTEQELARVAVTAGGAAGGVVTQEEWEALLYGLDVQRVRFDTGQLRILTDAVSDGVVDLASAVLYLAEQVGTLKLADAQAVAPTGEGQAVAPTGEGQAVAPTGEGQAVAPTREVPRVSLVPWRFIRLAGLIMVIAAVYSLLSSWEEQVTTADGLAIIAVRMAAVLFASKAIIGGAGALATDFQLVWGRRPVWMSAQVRAHLRDRRSAVHQPIRWLREEVEVFLVLAILGFYCICALVLILSLIAVTFAASLPLWLNLVAFAASNWVGYCIGTSAASIELTINPDIPQSERVQLLLRIWLQIFLVIGGTAALAVLGGIILGQSGFTEVKAVTISSLFNQQSAVIILGFLELCIAILVVQDLRIFYFSRRHRLRGPIERKVVSVLDRDALIGHLVLVGVGVVFLAVVYAYGVSHTLSAVHFLLLVGFLSAIAAIVQGMFGSGRESTQRGISETRVTANHVNDH